MRRRLKLEEYDYTVMYKVGHMNKNADALSRNPIASITYLSLFPIQKRCRFDPEVRYPDTEKDDSTDDERRRKLPVRIFHLEALKYTCDPVASDSSESMFSLPLHSGTYPTAPSLPIAIFSQPLSPLAIGQAGTSDDSAASSDLRKLLW